MENPKIETIMEWEGDGFVLWACRGAGRGCSRNKYRSSKKHCADCVRADPDETLQNLYDRLQRGDG